jgi:GTP-binding protein Era
VTHKAGFVNIVGKANVGKSTLLNALIGQELSVVNPRAQTTRHRIKAILNGEDYQIVFSDTPGIMKPAYKLHERMLNAVEETFTDADLVLFIVEAGERKMDDDLKGKLKSLLCPLFVIINKIDTTNQEGVEEAVARWQEMLQPELVLPVSALHRFNLDVLLARILEKLPESAPYYDKEDEISDRNVRFFVAEIIRGKILTFYQKEIPYSVEVVVEEYRESPEIDRIRVTIFCARESQKMILLGKGGAAIKKLGTEARKKIEEFVDKKVYLELTVKVADDWRDDEKQLRRFGYE